MKILEIHNKAAKVKLNEQVDKWSMDRLNEEIAQVFGATAASNGQNFGEIMNCAENAVDTLDIDIHSPGGSILDGYTLYNSILDLRGRGVFVTAHVTLAASMASVIAMAADKIVMKAGSRMMIHEASAATHGNAKDHADRAVLLESFSDEIAGIYAARTGMDKEKVRKMMMKETWMDGKTAVENGFADEYFDSMTKSEAMSLLARITNPSDIEAKERITALENQIQGHEAEVKGFEDKLVLAESALQEAATNLIQANQKIADFEAKVAEQDRILNENAQLIADLQEKAKVAQDKVAVQASELLAKVGQPSPVNLTDDLAADADKKLSRAAFNKLTPHERLAFVKNGGTIK